ncbi:Conserved hypothetical protein CHP03083 [Pseudonocardia dioxanivorans CB1190]|uniref:Mycothiol-dependent maleylpyruvate isomerase metal-binding domain-containing protein n=1 Tax=Pseudonocardia dioxanivorans (strain ATCC 55486 / DSM 44775 / JCM 13855 / CB1190) TaxID=675635 RepID=F4CXD2_PSEUX|nr:maleylpyruvate isomerase family mycothiol-dependent enzyme [Pseudonocardia dioxanivorans]AEA26506.1 Conserved hypothetical protein CHP03083 [Pseudonocardia dioxanivorans CB1190]
MTATKPDTKAMARAEREDLAAFLATLTPEEWDAPTLCTRWRVRDVVAHMFSYDDLRPLALVGRLAKGSGAANDIGVDQLGDRSPDELLALVRTHLTPRGLTAGFGARIALTDGTIHHQDIRRPLGRPREIPNDRLRVALDYARTAPPIKAKARVRGLTLQATDLDWRCGDGPVVEGPGESLLMAMAGRPVADELTGPGRTMLAERISA